MNRDDVDSQPAVAGSIDEELHTIVLAETASSMGPRARLLDHRGMSEYEGLDESTRLVRITAFRLKQLRESRVSPFRPIRHESRMVTLVPLVRLGRGPLAAALLLPQVWLLRKTIYQLAPRPTVYLLGYHLSRVGRVLSRLLGSAPMVIRHQIELPHGGFRRWLQIQALRRADLILVVSKGVRGQLVAAGLDRRRVQIRYAAVNPCFASLPSNRQSERGVRTVAFVGRLVSEKGPMDAIKAFESSALAHPQLRLEIIGTGPLEKALTARCRGSRFADRVSLIPRLPQEALAHKLDEVDIVIMPSRSEGFGRVAVESLLRGCVIVGYRTGGLPDACGPGGVLVEPGSVARLGLAINEIIASPIRLAEMRRAGLRHAREILISSSTPVTSFTRELQAHGTPAA